MDLKERIKPFPNKKSKIFGTITGISKTDDDNLVVKFDLVNEEVLKIDTELYKLYLNENKDDLKKIESKEYLFTYFMTIEMDLKKFDSKFKQFSEELLYEIEIIPENKVGSDGIAEYFESDVYFSASPIEREKFFSSFTGVTLPLKTTLLSSLGINPIKNRSDIDLALNNLFTYDLKVDKFTVHRVGQGSCNSIIFKLQNDKKLFYDIGISRYSGADTHYDIYTYTYSLFRMDKFNTVIISHWDEDHYLGIYLDACRKLLSKTWITPPIQNNWYNAKRLAFIISICGEIIMIDNSIKGYFYDKDDMYLFKGDGNGKNNSGIMVCLKNSVKNLVAMGDTSYTNSSFIRSHSGGIFSTIDHLVVPHHGAYFRSGIPFVPRTGYNSAIISVGYNCYRTPHPNSNTITGLTNAGFMIRRTDNDRKQVIEF